MAQKLDLGSIVMMHALKIGGMTALITFLGGTAMTAGVLEPAVGSVPAISLGTGLAAGVSVFVVRQIELAGFM